ncbi:hypothetical protein ACW9UR_12245 [Halovulum sp. GXIMD14794]
MLLRALILLGLVASASVALSYMFGAEVLAALGMMISQAKIVLAKLFTVTTKGAFIWLKAQGINFARVEIGKRWFMKSLVPMLIGAANQRRIAGFFATFKESAKTRYAAMMDWYKELPLAVKIISILIVMFATLALAISSMSLWLLVFSVQLPFWIIAGATAFGTIIWKSVQKLVFRTIAFMQLYRIWGFLKKRVPPEYLARKRRFDYRIARIVVRRRKMTLAQMKTGKDSVAMRLALIREYFRHVRPAVPSKEELDRARANRAARTEDTPAE